MRETALFLPKSDVTMVFLDRRFPTWRENKGDSGTNKAENWHYHDFQDLLAQNGGLGGNIEEELVRCWPPAKSFLPLCHFWEKLIKKCDRQCTKTVRQTDTRDKLNLLSVPYYNAIVMRQLIISGHRNFTKGRIAWGFLWGKNSM